MLIPSLTYSTVGKFGGKFGSEKNFPWKLMRSALADASLCIIGYPGHKCLLPGEYHNIAVKSKGIGGLTTKEISVLVEALKAGTMFIAKKSQGAYYV